MLHEQLAFMGTTLPTQDVEDWKQNFYFEWNILSEQKNGLIDIVSQFEGLKYIFLRITIMY